MASTMTIYDHLESEEAQELRKYLRGPSKKRKQNKEKHERIHDRIMISERSAEAEDRLKAGHFEGDMYWLRDVFVSVIVFISQSYHNHYGCQ